MQMTKKFALILAALSASATVHAAAVTFWDPTGYTVAGWNQTQYVADGLGGRIGVTYGVQPGFSTFDWNTVGRAPSASMGDLVGSASFGRGDLQGWTATGGVHAIRQMTPSTFDDNRNNYTITLDFSEYRGSQVGGVDGAANDKTFIGISDIYSGNLNWGRTTVTFSSTLTNGEAGSSGQWILLNGGAGPNHSTGGRNEPGALLSFDDGVLQGTGLLADGAGGSGDTVLGLLNTVGGEYKSITLSFDMFANFVDPSRPAQTRRTDNHGLYVGSIMEVPEPSTYALLGLGPMAIGTITRRRSIR